MIQKILCPTDFSAASNNAIEYAARMAQKMSATLTLLHIQPLYMGEGVSLFAGAERESLAEARESSRMMDDICLNVNKTFKVSCTHEIIPSMLGSVENAIAEESANFDLTILGTNGADNLGQLYFGTHSFKVAKKETGPVIIVPENCAYREIINLAFASDYKEGAGLSLEQLKLFTDAFAPNVRVFHISESDTEQSRALFRSFSNLTEDALNQEEQITFERIIHKNEADAIESVMNKAQVDLLALLLEKHGFFYRFFHENMIKKLTSIASFPILLFHK